MGDITSQRRPLVSVLVPTFNRPRLLREALASVVRQTYTDFEAIIVNDGGRSVRDVVEAFADPRLTLLERRENRGKAASLNEALARAAGLYVAYLDDDDLYYPHHLETLVRALKTHPGCGAAYTDLYKVHCRPGPEGRRTVLGKVVNVSRDFDRFFLCYFNLALHVSLMHRRDLLDKTGPYNEGLAILIDWDMVRRLAFFTDLVHVPEVTGEYYAPVGDCDRISCQGRRDRQAFLANTLMVRTTRPPKPWPKMPDLSIIVLPDRIDQAAADMITRLYAWTFMPYEVYLPVAASDAARLRINMPNLVTVPTAEGATLEQRVDAALERAGGDYVAVVPPSAAFGALWVEDALHAAAHDAGGRRAFQIATAEGGRPGFVVRTETLRGARRQAPGRSLADSLREAGIQVCPPEAGTVALGFDRMLQDAEGLAREGNWVQAAALYQKIPQRFGNRRWMSERAAHALFEAGNRAAEALALCQDLNRRQPTVSSLLLEAKLHKRHDRCDQAARLLERAVAMLEGKGPPCN